MPSIPRPTRHATDGGHPRGSHPLRRVALGATAGLAACVSLMPPVTAQAAAPITVTSTCGRLTVGAPGVATNRVAVVLTDHNEVAGTPGHTRQSVSVPAGSYTWMAFSTSEDGSGSDDPMPLGSGRTVVAACTPTSARRAVVGDENADARADVFALTTTGELRYYQTGTGTHLMAGVPIGSGWGTTDWIGRLTDQPVGEQFTQAGTPVANRLLAHRRDGSIWVYPDLGRGRLGAGTRIGTGFTGFSDFAVTQTNFLPTFGGHALTAVKGGKRMAWDITPHGTGAPTLDSSPDATEPATAVQTAYLPRMDADAWADQIDIDAAGTMRWTNYPVPTTSTPPEPVVREVGHGWNQMQIVTSPGDMDGDGFSDLIARRADGNLYVYRATGTGAWKAPLQIGSRWNSVSVLG